MNSEIKLLVSLLKNKKKIEIGNYIKWEDFLQHVINHSLIDIVFDNIESKKSKVPDNIYKFIQRKYYFNLLRNQLLWNEFVKIYNKCNKDKQLFLVPIKGISLMIRFYPNFFHREMKDIDILVNKENLQEINKAMSELGYAKSFKRGKEKYWLTKQCSMSYKKENVTVDVHWGLDLPPREKVLLAEVKNRMKTIRVKNKYFDNLSIEDIFLCFCLHKRRFGNILSLKEAKDMKFLIEYKKNDFDWNYVVNQAYKYHFRSTVYFCLFQVQKFCGLNLSYNICRSLRISWIKKKIIKLLLNKFTLDLKIKKKIKTIYLLSYILLFDEFYVPVFYIIFIPYEQFVKYYNLSFYTKSSYIKYYFRIIFIPILSYFTFLERRIGFRK